jgi:phage tail sheath protein FI
MTTQVTYPGVYIEEVPSSVHTITSVATSNTAFVDFFAEGDMNEPIDVFGMSDFQRIFGGLDRRSEASYAIAQFFLNGGSHAIVVRCAGGAPVSATVDIKSTAAAGPAVLTLSAANEGLWGNAVRVEIDHQMVDPLEYFNLTVTRYVSSDNDAMPRAQERHLRLSLDPADPRNVQRVLAQDSHLIRATVLATFSVPTVPLSCGTTSGDLSGISQAALDGLGANRKLRITPRAGVTFEATLTWNANDVQTIFQLATRLQQAIRASVDTAATPMVAPPCITGARVTALSVPGVNHLVVTAGNGDGLLNSNAVLAIANAGADTAADVLRLTAPTGAVANVHQYQLGAPVAIASVAAYVRGVAGNDGALPDANALVGVLADANDRGVYALRRTDLFNILCIPRAVASGVTEAQMQQIVERAIAFCEQKRAFFLVDIPESVNEVSEVRDWIERFGNFRSKNAALFFPRTAIADPLAEYRPRSFPNSGTMAGLFARIDGTRGVWKAPAGIEATLRGVNDLDYNVIDQENGILNPAAINCLRKFPTYGQIAWGSRTLEGADARASEWKYIPVRRLALMMEESLFRSTKWVVFEPNDEQLWAKIRLNVGAYLRSLFIQGAFQNISGNPRDSYYVKCDKETTTQDDINKGIVNIEVGFAPLKPAEFVVIKIQQMPGDIPV